MEFNVVCTILPSISLNKNDPIWLILQNRINIPVKLIFVEKITLAPGALRNVVTVFDHFICSLFFFLWCRQRGRNFL